MGSEFINEKVSVAIETLGCKLNQAESEHLARQLAEFGCKVVRKVEEADIYILNTCTVTHIADRKARHLLRMVHRNNPQARIIAIGCYAERAAAELCKIEGVDIVAGNGAKPNLPQLLTDKGILTSQIKSNAFHYNRTRSFIKAQDGCNSYCSYCVVPLVRGREKSLPPQQVIAEINNRIDDGCQEVVLTGTEIGRYGAEGFDLRGLVERVLNFTDISRLRLSSLQPQEISSDLIRLWQDSRLCRHFHLSLQSGSNSVLQRMNRLYSTQGFSQAVGLIHSEIPDAAITTDIIVGFPGETEAEFQESYDYCRRTQFSRIHVFSFSLREGTAAPQMKEQIASPLKKQRSEKMLELASSSQQKFNNYFLGRSETVLFENSSGGLYSGLTDTYIKVYTRSESDPRNKLAPAKLMELYRDGVWGEILQ